MITHTAIGQNLKALRNAQNLTQEQVVNDLEISHRYYGLVEQGNVNPSIGYLLRLSNYYGISLAEIVEDRM